MAAILNNLQEGDVLFVFDEMNNAYLYDTETDSVALDENQLPIPYTVTDTADGFDYLIGSVHYLDFGDAILGFDRSLEGAKAYIDENFGGDGLAFAKKYYETVMRLPEKGKFDILGHFDLLTKNNEQGKFIDTTDKKYLNLGFEAIHALQGKIPFFEVNTGAIARGYRTAP